MKRTANKVLAAALLSAGSLIAWFLLIFGSYLLGAVSDTGGSASLVIVPIAIPLLATFGFDCLRKLYRRKFDIKAPLFYLCAYAFPLVWTVISLIDTFKHYGNAYGGSDSDFYLGGLKEYYEQTFTPVAAMTVFGGMALWFGVWAFISAKNNAKSLR